MLLKNRLLVFLMLFLLIIPISFAQVCEVDRIKQVLRKILYIYFTEPGNVSLTREEVRDLLVFYISIGGQNLTVDCSSLGVSSNKPIFDMVNSGENLPDKIPSCGDGTRYGECSKSRPAYCYAGALYQKCDLCGCPANSVCGKSKKCETLAQNITCSKDIDCGQISFIGSYFCVNGYLYKNYVNYTCINPGTASSNCLAVNTTYILSYCNPILNQICVDEKSSCQSTASNATATNQTNQTTFDTLTIKGRYINKFTGQPLANTGFWLLKSPSTNLGTYYADSNGRFAVTASTTDITESVYKVLAQFAKCYMDDNGIVISRYPSTYKITGFNYTANALYVWINYFDLDGNPKYFSVAGSIVDVGDVPLWPSTDFSLTSDTPVKLDISYPEEGRGAGNSNYLTSHYLTDVVPLNYNARVQLTDSTGTNYYSPYTNVPLSNGCLPVSQNFFNKQFAWNTTTTQTNKTNLSVTVISPNGFESWQKGSNYRIQWNHPLQANFSGSQNMGWGINVFRPGDGVWVIGSTLPTTQSSYQWTIPTTLSDASDYKVRVFLAKNCIYSWVPCPEPTQILPDGPSDDSDIGFNIVFINQTITESTASNLVGYWKFDGNGNNEIPGGPSAIIAGNAAFFSSGGKYSGYAYIPSSSDYLRIPYNSIFDLPNSFTIEFWFRQRSNQSFNQNLVYKGSSPNNYNFNILRYLWNQYNSGAIISCYTSSVTGYWKQTSNPNQLAHNVWHHVAFTKSTSGTAYYLDGNLINSQSYTDPAKTPANDIIIGDSAVDTDVDNLLIYNRALNSSEVLQNGQS